MLDGGMDPREIFRKQFETELRETFSKPKVETARPPNTGEEYPEPSKRSVS
jgi:hypothetical protein